VTVTQGPRLASADQWDDAERQVDSVITLPRAREAGLGGTPAPHPRPARTPLRVLPTEHLERRTRRRRARLTLTVAASLVAGSLLGVVAVNVMIAQDQLRLDRLDAQRNAALDHRGQLQLQVAQLQSPARIVAQAEQRLGMVVPSKLTYLSGNGATVQTTGGGAIPAPLAPPSPPSTGPSPPATGPSPPATGPSPPATGPAPPAPTTPSSVPGSAHR
jgi:cell division protein FtsL